MSPSLRVIPNNDKEKATKAHRELIQKMAEDVAKITGQAAKITISDITISEAGTIPSQTIAASPKGNPLGIKVPIWGI